MSGKFEVYEDSAGKFRYRLKAFNGEVLASGGPCPSKASARDLCESVHPAADGAPIIEVGA